MNGKSKKQTKKIGEYVVLKKLGEGSAAKVYLAQHEKTEQLIAMKRIRIDKVAENKMTQKNFKCELYIMHKIRHPNVMHCQEFYESDNHYYILMEYCNKGTLEHLRGMRRPNISEEECMNYMFQIKEGFKALKEYKVIHRDVKLENLLLHDGLLKISDFGVAKLGKERTKTRLVGTILTMAPELMQICDIDEENPNYCSKVDLWSIGVVYYEILFRDTPFFGLTVGHNIAKMKKFSGVNLPIPKYISPEIEDLLRNLLMFDPLNRISWEDFFHHPAFDLYPISKELQAVYDTYNKEKSKQKTRTKTRPRKSARDSSQDNMGVFKRGSMMRLSSQSRTQLTSNDRSVSKGKMKSRKNLGTMHKSKGLDKSLKRSKGVSQRHLVKGSVRGSTRKEKSREKSSKKKMVRKASGMSGYLHTSFGKMVKSKSRTKIKKSSSRAKLLERSRAKLSLKKSASKGSIKSKNRLYRNRSNLLNLNKNPAPKSKDKVTSRLTKSKASAKSNSSSTSTFKSSRVKKISGKEVNKMQQQILKEHQRDFNVRLVNNRYVHEKNKIMFINLTIKKVRELIKLGIYQNLESSLYRSVIYLMKKAMLLARLVLRSLEEQNNIFDLDHFQQFIGSRYYKDIMQDFRTDIPNFEKYFNYLVEWAQKQKKTYIKDLEKKIESLRSNKTLSPSELDFLLNHEFDILAHFPIENFALSYIVHSSVEDSAEMSRSQILRAIDSNINLSSSVSEMKRDFYTVLFQLQYSIYCERHFPYQKESVFFDWKQFFDKFKDMDALQLRAIALPATN